MTNTTAAPKFTPGPWKHAGGFDTIMAGDGRVIAHMEAYGYHLPPIAQHDARLIAAAPDLYAALRNLADYAEARERVGDDAVPAILREISDADMTEAIHAARAALAKVQP